MSKDENEAKAQFASKNFSRLSTSIRFDLLKATAEELCNAYIKECLANPRIWNELRIRIRLYFNMPPVALFTNEVCSIINCKRFDGVANKFTSKHG